MKSKESATTGEEKMTDKLRLTAAWATGGDNDVLMGAPFHSGIDDQMIAQEEAEMAIARVRVSAHRYNSSALTTEQAVIKKAALEEKAHEDVCNPDICHCSGGKQHCHMKVHNTDNGRVLTRGPIGYCMSC